MIKSHLLYQLSYRGGCGGSHIGVFAQLRKIPVGRSLVANHQFCNLPIDWSIGGGSQESAVGSEPFNRGVVICSLQAETTTLPLLSREL